MSQPELQWDEEERALLKSAELDAPAAGAEARTLAALGVGGVALGTAVTTGSAKAAAVSVSKGFGVGKLLAVLVIGSSVGGAAFQYGAHLRAQADTATHTSNPVAPRPLASVAVAPAVTTAATVPDANTPSTPPELAPSVVKAAPASVATRSEPDIALEIAALDRARRASESGNYSAALNELTQYDRDFKQGRLRPEALLLRIQTLISKGDGPAAKALGAKFLARYPKSPLSPRIQKLIGATP